MVAQSAKIAQSGYIALWVQLNGGYHWMVGQRKKEMETRFEHIFKSGEGTDAFLGFQFALKAVFVRPFYL